MWGWISDWCGMTSYNTRVCNIIYIIQWRGTSLIRTSLNQIIYSVLNSEVSLFHVAFYINLRATKHP